MSKTTTGLTGEYYVLAQLAHRGYTASLTLGHTKGVDILVWAGKGQKYFRVEVKTSKRPPKRYSLFNADEKAYAWQLTEKNELKPDRDLVYCFVHLTDADELPTFFLVESTEVAKCIADHHQNWLAKPHKKEVKDGTMRKFLIAESDPNGYQNNWQLLGNV